MPLRIIQKRIDAHAIQKHEDISKSDRSRMPDEKVASPFSLGRFQKLRFGHDRERPDVRPAQLRIVVVMIVMRTPPDAARAQ